MKRTYGLALFLVVMIASGAVALGQSSKKTSEEDVAKTVAILDHIWLDAAHNGDTETMAWLFADNFVEIHPGGFIVNKKEQIDQIADPSAPTWNSIPTIFKCDTRRRMSPCLPTSPRF